MSDDKMILRKVEYAEQGCDFMFWCPGCKCGHGVWTTKRNGVGAIWQFNGSMDKPTFQPSLLLQWETGEPPVNEHNFDQWKKAPWPQTKKKNVCHSFIRDGQIQFLPDCTHELAGKTIPMEPF